MAKHVGGSEIWRLQQLVRFLWLELFECTSVYGRHALEVGIQSYVSKLSVGGLPLGASRNNSEYLTCSVALLGRDTSNVF